MKVTSKGRYALRAIIDIVVHGKGTPITLLSISNRQTISVHYLEQLFRRLKANDIVRAVRGPGGGYVLAHPMDDISIRDALLAVRENINIDVDINGSEALTTDTDEFHVLKEYFNSLSQTINDYFTTTSIGDLVRKHQLKAEKKETRLSFEHLISDDIQNTMIR
ncbi:MAG: Rrf2 family transcriptional regulator [Bacteriovoracaceae bacterium]|nr:Rrf2 family transcriptional regulator [Bacteriovoracaceae bacterium]